MTQAEYIASMRGKRVEHVYYSRMGQLIADHSMAVEHAAQLRKPLSDEVLKDYQHLRLERYGWKKVGGKWQAPWTEGKPQ